MAKMTDQEMELAVNAAFDSIDARKDLMSALVAFEEVGERAKAYLGRALVEHPDHWQNVKKDAENVHEMLGRELAAAKALRGVMLAHETSVENQ
jgi:hypothetical protein